MSVVTSVADEIVKKQTTLYREGKEGSKDLMSILGTYSIFTSNIWRQPVASPCKSIRKSQEQARQYANSLATHVSYSHRN